MSRKIHFVLIAWVCGSCSSFSGQTSHSGDGAKKLTDGSVAPSSTPLPGSADCTPTPGAGGVSKAALASAACPSANGSPAPDAPSDLVPTNSVPLSPEVQSCLGTAGIIQFSKAGLANIRTIGGSSFAPFASNKVVDDPQEYANDPNNPPPAIVLIKVSNIGPVGNSDIELLNRNALYCFVGQSSFTVFNNTKITICKGAKLSMGSATGLGGVMGDQMSQMIGTNPSVGTQTSNKLWINCKN